MVANVTSLTGNGLKDWLLQRASAIYFGLFALVLFFYVLLNPSMDYQQWHTLFKTPWVVVATVLALLNFVVHAWIGIWTVTTDYLTATAVRLVVQCVVFLFLLAQLVWGLMILWG